MKKYNLHYAVLVGDTKSFNAIMIKSPELILEEDIRGYTPINIAIEENNIYFFKKMFNKIDTIKILNDEDFLSFSFLSICCKSYKILKILIEVIKLNHPHLLNRVWRKMACTEDFNEKMFINLSLSMNMNDLKVNEKDDEGDTVLTYNCGWGRVSRIKSLLKLGCDPNLSDKDGDSPLAWAVQSGYWKAVALLIKAGARCDESSRGLLGSPLHQAAYVGSYKTIELLINTGSNPKEKDKNELNFVQKAKLAKENFMELKNSSKKIIINRLSGEDVYHIYFSNNGYKIFVDNYDKIINKFEYLFKK